MRNAPIEADAVLAVVPASTSIGALGGASIGLTIVQLLLVVGVYVWTALALRAVFRKVGQPEWKAWTPIVNVWTLFELAGMKGWWAVVQAVGGLVVAIVASVVGTLFVVAAQDAAFRGSSASAAGALAGAAAVPLLLYAVYLVGVVVLQLRMMRPLNRGFGLGAGHVVLGALLLPVWASIVGWGPAAWRGVPRPGIPPTPFAAAAPAPAPVDTASFAPPAPAAHAPAPGAPAGHAPPPAAPRPAAVPTAPAAWVPPPAAPVVAPPTEDVGDVEDETILAAHRRPQATLHLPDGTSLAIAGDAVLGRNPTPPTAAPGAQRIAIEDVTRTVSKTHALLRRGETGWTLTDLSSTNGVVVGDGEDEIPVATPTPVTGRFLLGDAEFHLDPGAR